jgi:hypothetical protein
MALRGDYNVTFSAHHSLEMALRNSLRKSSGKDALRRLGHGVNDILLYPGHNGGVGDGCPEG